MSKDLTFLLRELALSADISPENVELLLQAAREIENLRARIARLEGLP